MVGYDLRHAYKKNYDRSVLFRMKVYDLRHTLKRSHYYWNVISAHYLVCYDSRHIREYLLEYFSILFSMRFLNVAM